MEIGHPKHGHAKHGRVGLTGPNTDDAIVAKSRQEVASLENRSASGLPATASATNQLAQANSEMPTPQAFCVRSCDNDGPDVVSREVVEEPDDQHTNHYSSPL